MTALKHRGAAIGEQVAEGVSRAYVCPSHCEAHARKILDRVGLPEAKFPAVRSIRTILSGPRSISSSPLPTR